MQLETGDGVKADERSKHKNVAMCEVDQSHNAVDHGVTESDQGIDKAQLQTINNLLQEQAWIGLYGGDNPPDSQQAQQD